MGWGFFWVTFIGFKSVFSQDLQTKITKNILKSVKYRFLDTQLRTELRSQ